MSEAVKQLVKKHKIGLFLDPGTGYKRIKKSETLTISMNPEENEYDYIADENPTTEVDRYKPSIDQDLTMYKGEDDYEMVWPYFYERKTGQEAHIKCMIVFMHEPASGGGYLAWETDSVLFVQDLATVDKKLNFKVIFAGDITNGVATMSAGAPTFKASTEEVASNAV